VFAAPLAVELAFGPWADPVRDAITTATGLPGLGIIWVYSFLIAFILPMPSEIVLAAPLSFGLPGWATTALIVLASGAGKATGSVVALALGYRATHSGPVIRLVERLPWDVMGWTERRSIEIAEEYGYVGLALALSVPGFPDTLSIYAFTVLPQNYARFALATFAGSVGRLLVTIGAYQVLIRLI
jgi:membrane protein YqaA with SNARE-associated domain